MPPSLRALRAPHNPPAARRSQLRTAQAQSHRTRTGDAIRLSAISPQVARPLSRVISSCDSSMVLRRACVPVSVRVALMASATPGTGRAGVGAMWAAISSPRELG
ncbi:unnamed protein product [Rangifer tarandus platyrhynchus]|uniref:Uncharacterized protein n=1 Tax=Rangifer tarandus platyrhynchus TaxID=3082113 RepID=A0AC59Z118_RANTA